jgi:hypothetical protein
MSTGPTGPFDPPPQPVQKQPSLWERIRAWFSRRFG